MIPEVKGNTVLVAVLDWGLGHAARSVPIVKQLLAKNKKVVLGGSGNSGILFQSFFPELPYIELPGYAPTYAKGKNMYWPMAKQSLKFLRVIKQENKRLKGIITQHKIDTVISDNRYGLYHSAIETIFITHQLFIRAGALSRVVNKMNHGYIKKYNQCWVPDFENINESLAGELSHGKHSLAHVVYIGPLSRFTQPLPVTKKKYKSLAILSGPEPKRTQLEKMLLDEFSRSEGEFVIVQGLPGEKSISEKRGNTLLYCHANDSELEELICGSEQIICRAGYSGIMDLWVTSRLQDARLIPTPGQTEQEYLARWVAHRALVTA